MKRPKMLILDEATSALDSESEALVQVRPPQTLFGEKSAAIFAFDGMGTVDDAEGNHCMSCKISLAAIDRMLAGHEMCRLNPKL